MPYIPHLQENNTRKGFFEPWQFDGVLAKLRDYIRPPITFAYYTGWRLQHEILLVALGGHIDETRWAAGSQPATPPE